MDHHRLLYKINNSVMSPKNCKRKVAHEIRATKRSELYSSTRNISLSPLNRQENVADEQKENFKPPFAAAPVKPDEFASKKEPVACLDSLPSSKINEKQSRQKAHLMRFLAWKAEKAKQAQLKEKKCVRAPFVVPTGGAVGIESRKFKKSFAPKNYGFNPPDNLKDLTVEVVGVNSIRCVNGGQQATYHFVETPKKKCNMETRGAFVKSTRARTLPLTKSNSKPVAHKTPISVQKNIQKPAVASATTTTVQKLNIPTTSTKKVPSEVKAKQTPAATVPPKVQPIPVQKSVKSETKPTKQLIRPKMPPPLQLPSKPLGKQQNNLPLKPKMPPPTQQAPQISKTAQTTTAVTRSASTKLGSSKPVLPALKRPTFKAPKKTNSSISNALLATNGGIRSKISGVQPKFKLNGTSLLQSIKETTKCADPIPETPTDVNPVNTFLNFVTSTKRKSSSSKDLKADLLFTELGNTISPVDDCCPTPAKTDEKFKFIRYSIVQSDKDYIAKLEDAEKSKVTAGPSESDQVTPDKIAAPPTTYMSPYVSVSRGKVNSKIEREKRNSIYMTSADNSATTMPEATSVVRRTLATVRYYRKQLMDEIARLNEQCRIWEQYKKTNAELIEDGVDMIDVTTGQTRLLTSKKLKQFGGLIDRCEDGVLGKSSTCNGGGEAATPILPEDLEGFWSMVSLQIENVDKRFADLERWKANNWADPDDIPKKASNNLTNAKKTKKRKPVATTTARPNGALQKMLRTAHAAYLNKKALGADEDIILTPSKSRQVLIRDRRSRSAAATVITVNSPRMNRKSAAFEAIPSTDPNESPKLLYHVNHFRKSLNLLKSTLLGAQEKKSPVIDFGSPLRHPALCRKSILKTPGSTCRPKSVVFKTPPMKFTVEDTLDDWKTISNGDQQEQDQRTYKLRNRRIILRDSAEFVIPK